MLTSLLIDNKKLRTLIWRIGRKLYCLARGDLENNPLSNGEYWLLERIAEIHKGEECLYMDIGANLGLWTMHAKKLAGENDVDLRVIASEPCSGTRKMLEDRLRDIQDVRATGLAFSDREGEGEFYYEESGAGTNSLNKVSGGHSEKVTLATIDKFCAEEKIKHVAMIKIDTEGFDLKVLYGAEDLLNAGAIEIIQFEYNWRWILNHSSLYDVFEYIKDKPYHLGKLVGNSIEIYQSWHFEMDRYFENNYVLIKDNHPILRKSKTMTFGVSNCAVPADSR